MADTTPTTAAGQAETNAKLDKLVELMTAVASALAGAAGAKKTGGAIGVAVGGGAGAEGAGGLSSVFAVLTGAVGQVAGAFFAVTAATQSFVQALNPRLVEIFNTAFRNLQATIGVGFQPIFEAGIGLFRDLAVQVAPLFIALKPLVESVATLIAGQLSSSVGALVPVFAALVPVVALLFNLITPLLSVLSLFGTIVAAVVQVALIPFQIVAVLLNAVLAPVIKLFSAFTEGLQLLIGTFSKLIGVLVDSFGALLTGLFGGLLEQTIKAVVDAFQLLAKWIVVAAYTLAKLAGLDDLAARIKKAFSNQSSLAQGPTSIKGLEQVGKDLALASVTAVSGASKEASNADLLKELESIDTAVKGLPEAIARAGIKKTPGGETALAVYDAVPSYAGTKRAAEEVGSFFTFGIFDRK